MDKYSELLKSFDHICTLTSIETLNGFLRFFKEFNEQYPNILPRSRLLVGVSQTLLTLKVSFTGNKKALGTIPFEELVKAEMLEMSIPLAEVNHEKTAPFIERVSQRFLQTFRFFSYNRARQRRKLSRQFDEWANHQQEVRLLVFFLSLIRQTNWTNIFMPSFQIPKKMSTFTSLEDGYYITLFL